MLWMLLSAFDGCLIQVCCLLLQVGNGTDVLVFDPQEPMPSNPSKGLNVLRLELGDVVDVVLQNNAANAFNGDYRYSIMMLMPSSLSADRHSFVQTTHLEICKSSLHAHSTYITIAASSLAAVLPNPEL